jgi:ribonuclease P protein component
MDIYARRSEKVTSTFGFTTSRQLKKAVERNRARRLMREAVRLNRHRIAEGWEIILAWRVGIKGVGYIRAEKEILTLLEKFGILQVTSQEGGL